MKFKNIIIVIAIILTAISCNQDEVFEKEQYKNVFALISSGSDNVYTKFFDLRKETDTGYISFSVGGTNPTDKDLTINLVEDFSLIDKYNQANFDMNVDKYYQALSKDRYEIESMQCIIPAGEIGAQVPFKINSRGLSPDSSYFIAVRVDSYSDFEVNPNKDYLLYRVRIKNYWATSDGTGYTMTARRREVGTTTEISLPGNKPVHPIAENKVRVLAGNETYKSDKEVFNKSAIVLEVDENNQVTITPYRDIEVTQIDGDPLYPNTFKIEDDGFKVYKTFLLSYNYKASNGKTYQMKEELRLQFNPKEEKDEEEFNN